MLTLKLMEEMDRVRMGPSELAHGGEKLAMAPASLQGLVDVPRRVSLVLCTQLIPGPGVPGPQEEIAAHFLRMLLLQAILILYTLIKVHLRQLTPQLQFYSVLFHRHCQAPSLD
jgi:hypothetical protein